MPDIEYASSPLSGHDLLDELDELNSDDELPVVQLGGAPSLSTEASVGQMSLTKAGESTKRTYGKAISPRKRREPTPVPRTTTRLRSQIQMTPNAGQHAQAAKARRAQLASEASDAVPTTTPTLGPTPTENALAASTENELHHHRSESATCQHIQPLIASEAAGPQQIGHGALPVEGRLAQPAPLPPFPSNPVPIHNVSRTGSRSPNPQREHQNPHKPPVPPNSSLDNVSRTGSRSPNPQREHQNPHKPPVPPNSSLDITRPTTIPVKITPPTPQGPVRLMGLTGEPPHENLDVASPSSALQFSSRNDSNGEDTMADGDEDFEPDATAKNLGGRPSHEDTTAIEESIGRMEALLLAELETLNVSRANFLKTWLRNEARIPITPNTWNDYGGYFKDHLEQELARVPEVANVPRDNISTNVRLSCYLAFKGPEGEPAWQEILKSYCDAKRIRGMGETVAERRRRFEKMYNKVCRDLRSYEESDGFQAALVVSGNVVNQDGSLGNTFTTSAAKDFFSDRCGLDSDQVIGHLKAHVFNAMSLREAETARLVRASKPKADDDDDSDDDDDTHAEPRDTSKANGASAAKIRSAAAAKLDAALARSEALATQRPVDLQKIKTTFINMAGNVGVTFNIRQFPWQTMPEMLAEGGVICINWPEEVLMPGEKRAPKRIGKDKEKSKEEKKGKGISDLTLREKGLLADALVDKRLPIRFVQVEYRKELIDSRRAVIIGVPPPFTSQEERGRRKFVDETIDRKGPRRQTEADSAAGVQADPVQTLDNRVTKGQGASPADNGGPSAPRASGKGGPSAPRASGSGGRAPEAARLAPSARTTRKAKRSAVRTHTHSKTKGAARKVAAVALTNSDEDDFQPSSSDSDNNDGNESKDSGNDSNVMEVDAGRKTTTMEGKRVTFAKGKTVDKGKGRATNKGKRKAGPSLTEPPCEAPAAQEGGGYTYISSGSDAASNVTEAEPPRGGAKRPTDSSLHGTKSKRQKIVESVMESDSDEDNRFMKTKRRLPKKPSMVVEISGRPKPKQRFNRIPTMEDTDEALTADELRNVDPRASLDSTTQDSGASVLIPPLSHQATEAPAPQRHSDEAHAPRAAALPPSHEPCIVDHRASQDLTTSAPEGSDEAHASRTAALPPLDKPRTIDHQAAQDLTAPAPRASAHSLPVPQATEGPVSQHHPDEAHIPHAAALSPPNEPHNVDLRASQDLSVPAGIYVHHHQGGEASEPRRRTDEAHAPHQIPSTNATSRFPNPSYPHGPGGPMSHTYGYPPMQTGAPFSPVPALPAIPLLQAPGSGSVPHPLGHPLTPGTQVDGPRTPVAAHPDIPPLRSSNFLPSQGADHNGAFNTHSHGEHDPSLLYPARSGGFRGDYLQRHPYEYPGTYYHHGGPMPAYWPMGNQYGAYDHPHDGRPWQAHAPMGYRMPTQGHGPPMSYAGTRDMYPASPTLGLHPTQAPIPEGPGPVHGPAD